MPTKPLREDLAHNPTTGEYFLPRLHRLPDAQTRLEDVPPKFMHVMAGLWVLGTPYRFNKDFNACWIYQQRGSAAENKTRYPRINTHGDTRFTSMRRYMAGTFYDMDAVHCYTVMKCGNFQCLNPRHMVFTDHPRPSKELIKIFRGG